MTTSVLVLLPKGSRPGVEPIASACGLELFADPDPRQERLRFHVLPAAPLLFQRDVPKYQEVVTAALSRQVWRAETRHGRRERRWFARDGHRGRRGARPMPMAQRFETVLYVEDSVPERVREWAVCQWKATPVAVAWRRMLGRYLWADVTSSPSSRG